MLGCWLYIRLDDSTVGFCESEKMVEQMTALLQGMSWGLIFGILVMTVGKRLFFWVAYKIWYPKK